MKHVNADPYVSPDSTEVPQSVEDAMLGHSPDQAKKEGLRDRLANFGRAAVIAAEVSPANETMRIAAFGAAQALSGDPAIGALAYGGSTLAIEGSAGIATSGALDTGMARKTTTRVNRLLEKIGIDPNVKTGRITKAATTLLGGTAISMVLKHREDPDRTRAENRQYGFKSAASLAGVCAVQGYFMSKGISVPSPETIGGGLAAFAGAQAGAKGIIGRFRRGREQREAAQFQDYLPDSGINIGLTFKKSDAKKALKLEQRIWDENGFGSLKEYRKYNKQSRVFTAFKDDECIGVTRLFAGGPHLPPFTELPITDNKDWQKVEEDCVDGVMEELGTTAVDHDKSDASKHVIALDMWRLAYRDARSRGIKKWGIIMEPERVAKMNQQFNFTFKQLGPAVDYQGGDCAAFVMDLEEVDEQMQANMPDLYDWFVNQPLNSNLTQSK